MGVATGRADLSGAMRMMMVVMVMVMMRAVMMRKGHRVAMPATLVMDMRVMMMALGRMMVSMRMRVSG